MKQYRINLLQHKRKPITLIDKLIFFALHYLRYIIIITQIIVIGVFFYRFIIDQQVIDLKESVNQKQEIIHIALPIVQEAKAFETKTTAIKKILDQQNQFSVHFDYIVSIIPESIIIKTLNLTAQGITLAGNAPEVTSIRALYERVQKDKKFKNVSLEKITKDESLFTFSINITI